MGTYGPFPLAAAVVVRCVSSTVTELVVLLAAARSGTPSPLKSPTAAKTGSVPTAGLIGGAKFPLPAPSRTVIVLLPALATARSGFPSPLQFAPSTGYGN